MSIIFSSKFVKTLQTFSEAERKSFDTWLRSPWCNSNKNLIRLLEKLSKYYPTFDDRKLTKEKLFKQVLPKGKFSDRRMNNLLSEGYLASERFLVFQNLAQDKQLQKDLLSKEWQNRDQEDWFFKSTQKEIDKLEAKPIKDWEDHLDLLRFHRRLYHHPNQSRRVKYGNAIITKMGEELELLYLIEKATILNEKIFRTRILQNEQHETTADLQLWLEATENLNHPAIDFYKMRFAYTEENRLEYYWKLRNAFLERFEELSEMQQKIHLVSLLNDTSLLMKFKLIDSTENLPLYKLGLETGLLFHKGKISYTTYATIIGASNTKRTFDFTHRTIENYTKNVDKKFQLDCETWAKAHTAYYEKKLEKSLDILLYHNFSIPYFQLLSRVLNTQVYFDLCLKDESYQDYLFSYFNSFEKWMMREKIWSKQIKKSTISFIQSCRTLAKYYYNSNFPQYKIDKLLENKEHIQSLDWLIQKKQELMQMKRKSRSI